MRCTKYLIPKGMLYSKFCLFTVSSIKNKETCNSRYVLSVPVFFAKLRGFKLQKLQKNPRILEPRKLELFCLAQIAEGIEVVSFYFLMTGL